MVKAFIITKNIHLVSKLLNVLQHVESEVLIERICISKEETSEYVEKTKAEIVFIDKENIDEYTEELFMEKDIKVTPVELIENGELSKNSIEDVKKIILQVDVTVRREKAIEELISMGYKSQYSGTFYMADAAVQMYLNRSLVLDNLRRDIYPVLSKKYGKTIWNIKSSMTKATEDMYYDGNLEILKKYFKDVYNTKPTIKQVVVAIANTLQ